MAACCHKNPAGKFDWSFLFKGAFCCMCPSNVTSGTLVVLVGTLAAGRREPDRDDKFMYSWSFKHKQGETHAKHVLTLQFLMRIDRKSYNQRNLVMFFCFANSVKISQNRPKTAKNGPKHEKRCKAMF